MCVSRSEDPLLFDALFSSSSYILSLAWPSALLRGLVRADGSGIEREECNSSNRTVLCRTLFLSLEAPVLLREREERGERT